MPIVQNMITYGPVVYVNWPTTTTTGLVGGYPGGWQITNSGKTIEYIIQDSANCGGPNPNVQTGFASSTFITGPSAYQFVPVLSGRGESQAPGYENMYLALNGVNIIRATSAGGGLGCAPGTPVTITTLVAGPYILPAGSSNTFTLSFSTTDALYHVACYYRCDIQFIEL